MANPQPDQHTRLANELMDQIPFFKFNGSQFRIIMVVWRNTYGWNRKDHDLSITFIHERTGLSESTVKKEIAGLVKAKVLLVTKSATHHKARKLSFNKNYEAWTIPKCGDSMDEKSRAEGHDCTPLPDYSEGHDCTPPEGHDCTPLPDYSEGHDCTPPEGHDCTPQVITQGGTIVPPNKEILLKKSFKENVELFETFYQSYPRRISKQAALKAWTKLCKNEEFDADLVIRNTLNFAKTQELLETSKIHIPHPSTYLNQQRYEDYVVVDPEGIAVEKKPASKQDRNKSLLQQKMEEAYEQDRDHPTLIDSHDSLPFG